MGKDRRLVEDFIFRDESNVSLKKSILPLASLVLPTHELRYSIDEAKLEELTATVKSVGLIEPILVRPIDNNENRFEIVAGARRYRAAERAGLSEVPVVIRELSDEETLEVAIVENLQREDLNSLEETEAVLRLLALKLGIAFEDVPPLLHRIQNELRERIATNNVIGKAEIEIVGNVFNSLGLMEMDSFINNRLPLLNLPREILEALRRGKIAYTKAQAIARVKDEQERQVLLATTISENLSLNQIKESIARSAASTNSVNDSKPSSLKNRLKTAYRLVEKSDIWKDPKKQKRLERLLGELEALVSKS
jgi:ParB family chromosome partitioning protein